MFCDNYLTDSEQLGGFYRQPQSEQLRKPTVRDRLPKNAVRKPTVRDRLPKNAEQCQPGHPKHPSNLRLIVLLMQRNMGFTVPLMLWWQVHLRAATGVKVHAAI